MQIAIQTQGLDFTHRLRRHIEQRLHNVLNFAKRDIRKAEVWLTDENSRSDVNDKYCRIQIKARGLSLIITENHSSNIYVALESALHRTKRNISRNIKKLKMHRHKKRTPLLEGSI